MADEKQTFDPMMLGSWQKRRHFMYAITGFCMLLVTLILLKPIETDTADTIVLLSFLSIMGTMGSYVFGATWQDIQVARAMGGGPMSTGSTSTMTLTRSQETTKEN